MSGTVRREARGGVPPADPAARGGQPAGTSGGTASTGAPDRHRLPSWRTVVPALAAVALLGGAAWIVLGSPLLAVDRVAVEGTRRLTAEQVRAVADVGHGVPLARVDTAAVAARVERIARVADARVVRRWPRTLAVVVVERQALAGVRRPEGYALLDGDGVPFDRVESLPGRVPLVEAGGRDRHRSLRAGLEVLVSLPPELRERVRTVSATTGDDVALALAGGRRVVWGSPDRGQRKALVLRALLRRPAQVYDVSAPDAPTTR